MLSRLFYSMKPCIVSEKITRVGELCIALRAIVFHLVVGTVVSFHRMLVAKRLIIHKVDNQNWDYCVSLTSPEIFIRKLKYEIIHHLWFWTCPLLQVEVLQLFKQKILCHCTTFWTVTLHKHKTYIVVVSLNW